MRGLLASRPAGEFVRVRPLNLSRHAGDIARLREFDARWRAARGNHPWPRMEELLLNDLLPSERRLIAGGFLGADPHSLRVDIFGAELRPPPGRNTVEGALISDFHRGPYFDAMLRDYHDVRQLGVPRWREVYAELPNGEVGIQRLHYLGGIWPVSADGKRVTGLVMLSSPQSSE